VTKKKRAGGQLSKKTSKRKKVATLLALKNLEEVMRIWVKRLLVN
jgi:hypothetical protein